ncbi:unnamed protein product, partial [Dicrocoelium dendriticum]
MWKQGIIIPIFKRGSRSEPVNYCPVIHFPVLAKVMEAIIPEAVMDYFERSNIIAPEQHGFRQHRSLTTNLAITRGGWTVIAEPGTDTDVIYLDFLKSST